MLQLWNDCYSKKSHGKVEENGPKIVSDNENVGILANLFTSFTILILIHLKMLI